MRIDRAVSLILAAMRSRYRGYRIAILMYHSISDRKESRSHPYFHTATSPVRFAQQMQWLADAGAEIVALDDWNMPVPRGRHIRVIITFDDGFADFLSAAFPVLKAYGYFATMFLPTSFIGTGKELSAGMEHLGWDDIRQLSKKGISFGSHTASHRHLETLSCHEIDEEVRISAETMNEKLGAQVKAFSCPFAFPQAHPKVITALCESLACHGYNVGVTTKIGTVFMHDNPYKLRRLPVNSDDDKKLFMAKLNGGYNWLTSLQHMTRIGKKVLHR